MEASVVGEVSLAVDIGSADASVELVAWMREQRCWPTSRIAIHRDRDESAALTICRVVESCGAFIAEPGDANGFIRPSESFAYYAATEIEIYVEAGKTLTLSPGAPPPPPLNGRTPFAVITAWNPMSLKLDRTENLQLEADLGRWLDSAGLRSRLATGRALDGTHAEDSRAVWGLDLREACALGSNFGQRAIFWVGKPAVTIRDCAPVRELTDRWRLDFGRLCADPSAASALAAVCRDFRAGECELSDFRRLVAQLAPALHPGWIGRLLESEHQAIEVC